MHLFWRRFSVWFWNVVVLVEILSSSLNQPQPFSYRAYYGIVEMLEKGLTISPSISTFSPLTKNIPRVISA